MEKEISYQRLGRRTFWVFVFESSTPAIVVFIIWLGLLFVEAFGLSPSLGSTDNLLTLGILVGTLLLLFFTIFAFIVATIRYFGYAYSLGDNSFHISLGILNKFDISIPYRQIQDVNLERTFINRMWGVSRLSILTAGTEDTTVDGKNVSDGDIPLIEKGKADYLRQELLKRANNQNTTTA